MDSENAGAEGNPTHFSWRIDRESPVPLYLQIRQQLMLLISGWTDASQRFPSDEELAQQFDVTKATIRQAIGDLTRAGLLRRRRGAGTFVVPPLVERLKPSAEIEKNYNLSGGSVSYKIHSLRDRAATAAEAETLSLEVGTPVVWLRRVRSLAHVPVAIDDRVMSRAVADRLELDAAAAATSIIDRVQSRFKLTRAAWELNARLAGFEDSILLQIPPSDPILSRTLVYYQGDGRAILMGDTRHRSDLLRCGFEMDLSDDGVGTDVRSWTGEALLARPNPALPI